MSEDKRRKTEYASVMEGRDGVEGGKGLSSQLASSEDLRGFASEKDIGRCGRVQQSVSHYENVVSGRKGKTCR